VNCSSSDHVGNESEAANSLALVRLDPMADETIVISTVDEIEITQQRNTRAKVDKTYHLILSFRNERPNAEQLREIERAFAETLGFSEHQRIVAAHDNTDNFHIHIAYNKIHPESLRVHVPYRDHLNLQKTCRKMEKEYGLGIDAGERASLSPQQVVLSRMNDIKLALAEVAAAASNWEELHNGFAEHNVTIRRVGNGLVMQFINEKTRVKASDVSSAFAIGSLKKRLGDYQIDAISRSRSDTGQNLSEAETKKHGAIFRRRVKPLARKLEEIIANAKSWQDVHHGFAKHGLQIRRRGRGLVITDESRTVINLEAVRREMSAAAKVADAKVEISSTARDYERKTFEQSFERYVKNLQAELTAVLFHSKNWQDIHDGFHKYGVRIKPRGNGLVIASLSYKEHMKASSLHRGFSKASLEKWFGAFQPDQQQQKGRGLNEAHRQDGKTGEFRGQHRYQAPAFGLGVSRGPSSRPSMNMSKDDPAKRYERKPLFHHPEQQKLWAEYNSKSAKGPVRSPDKKRNWRDHLLEREMANDPLAHVLITHYETKLSKTILAHAQQQSRGMSR